MEDYLSPKTEISGAQHLFDRMPAPGSPTYALVETLRSYLQAPLLLLLKFTSDFLLAFYFIRALSIFILLPKCWEILSPRIIWPTNNKAIGRPEIRPSYLRAKNAATSAVRQRNLWQAKHSVARPAMRQASPGHILLSGGSRGGQIEVAAAVASEVGAALLVVDRAVMEDICRLPSGGSHGGLFSFFSPFFGGHQAFCMDVLALVAAEIALYGPVILFVDNVNDCLCQSIGDLQTFALGFEPLSPSQRKFHIIVIGGRPGPDRMPHCSKDPPRSYEGALQAGFLGMRHSYQGGAVQGNGGNAWLQSADTFAPFWRLKILFGPCVRAARCFFLGRHAAVVDTSSLFGQLFSTEIFLNEEIHAERFCWSSESSTDFSSSTICCCHEILSACDISSGPAQVFLQRILEEPACGGASTCIESATPTSHTKAKPALAESTKVTVPHAPTRADSLGMRQQQLVEALTQELDRVRQRCADLSAELTQVENKAKAFQVQHGNALRALERVEADKAALRASVDEVEKILGQTRRDNGDLLLLLEAEHAQVELYQSKAATAEREALSLRDEVLILRQALTEEQDQGSMDFGLHVEDSGFAGPPTM